MTEAKRRVADVLEDVAAGEGVTVTRRGQTVFARKPGFVTFRRGDPEKLKLLGIDLPRAKKGEKTAADLGQEARDERMKRIGG